MTPLNRQERKIITLASLGGMLEFYDFIIYGVFSVYFARHFFPSNDQLIVILQSYLVFVLGYIARPIGGIVFSHIGDEYGRKKVLVMTIVLMGLASLGIGILPTYHSIGITAPILLLSLRITQGLALGGELPSTYVYINETIVHNRGLAFGLTMVGVNSGLLLGMLINYLLASVLSEASLIEFGWRIPFIFGGLTCIISYKIRKTLYESAVFNRIHDKPKLPIIYLFRHHVGDVIAGTALTAIMASLVVTAIIYMPTYLHTMLKYNDNTISHIMIVAMLLNVAAIYLTGIVTQYFHPFIVFKKLILLAFVLAPAGYWFIYAGHVVTGVMTLAILEGIAAMITPCIITLIFESKIRATGVALCYNLAFTIFGGLGPLIITHGIKQGYNIFLVPTAYLLLTILICWAGYSYLYHQRKLNSH